MQKAMKLISFGIDESILPPTKRSAYERIRSRALFVEPDEMRFYPNDTLAAHVLGYVGVDDRPGLGKVFETIGKEGLELTLNNTLTGIQGWRQTETDSRRRELLASAATRGEDGDVDPVERAVGQLFYLVFAATAAERLLRMTIILP